MSRLGELAQKGLVMPEFNASQRQVMKNIAQCQTADMGTNTEYCACGNVEIHYNSCRDRHCPLCQGSLRAKWVADRLQELLPCPYFHVVFTVATELRDLAQANRRIFNQLLFKSVHETLLAVAGNPDNLGARIGGLSVLHTWNQKLAFHPHLHCIVPGGGLSPEGKWIPGNPNYLLPVRRLSLVFRGKFLSFLEKALQENQLYGNPADWQKALKKAASKAFVVYAKKPFGGPAQVLKYLGRYTHRVGISEQRIVHLTETTVTFSWLDRKNNHCRELMSLTHREFLKKFMLHLIPKGLRKIRYFGYMANRNRQGHLDNVRKLIIESGCAIETNAQPNKAIDDSKPSEKLIEPRTRTCRLCGQKLTRQRPIPILTELVILDQPGAEPNLNTA